MVCNQENVAEAKKDSLELGFAKVNKICNYYM